MAERRQFGVVEQVVSTQPPFPEQGSHEGGYQSTYVYKHVEYLEAGVALPFGYSQCLFALLCRFGLMVVVHLTNDSLQIAFEETVAKSNEEEGQTGERQEPPLIVGSGKYGDSQHHITRGHDNQTGHYGTLVVLRAVGNDTTHQTEDVYAGIEEGIDDTARLIGQAELGTEEEHEHRVHDIISEAFAHIAQGCLKQSFRMVFKHSIYILVFVISKR